MYLTAPVAVILVGLSAAIVARAYLCCDFAMFIDNMGKSPFISPVFYNCGCQTGQSGSGRRTRPFRQVSCIDVCSRRRFDYKSLFIGFSAHITIRHKISDKQVKSKKQRENS